jgi:proteasome lid subunit RPN8/RPN11
VVLRLLDRLTSRHRNTASRRQTPKLLMTEACLQQIRIGLEPEIRKGHEGIVYLLGRTDGVVTLAVSVFRPEAETTRGSFSVDSRAMAVAVRTAARFGLQIVAQVHTHPGAAFHSDGDVEGAKIRYGGYSSLVIPSFGRNLSSLAGVAAYMFVQEQGWNLLDQSSLMIVPANV